MSGPDQDTNTDAGVRFRAATEIASRAGALANAHWRDRDRLVIEAKASPQDLVSEADQAVERLIRADIAGRFPDDGVLGEEFGLDPGRSGFTWVIDPIDGTAPFLHGMPSWCVSIAVLKNADPVVGVIEVPSTAETFAALAGAGATLNGRPLRVPEGLTLQTGITAVGASHRTDPDAAADAVRRLLAAGGMYYRNGSGALMLAYVAAGRLAGYFEPAMYPWDALAGLLIISEAGGRAAPFGRAGDPFGEDRALAGSPAAWDALVELFGG